MRHSLGPLMSPVLLMLILAAGLATAQPSYYDAGVSACVPGAGYDHFPFCNTSMPLADRVHDLISRIPDGVKPNLLTARGHLKSRGRQALPELGVPSYYWGTNCIHSSMSANCTKDGRCSTSFPSGPSWSATFDRNVMRSMAAVVGRETRAFFNLGNFTDNGRNGMGLDCWGPVANINRDPRWGRHGEGGTEDPFLMGQLGVAWTKGLQEGEDQRYIQVAVTIKHFDANSLEGGAAADQGYDRHNFSANISKYLLADYYWPAFRASIKLGKAKGVMCSYNSVNGIPVCLDPLMKAARAAWGFDGYVTSDSDAVSDAWRRHHYVKSAAEASCLALKHGQCDIDSGNTYYDHLLEGVKAGHCSMEDINRALFNTLRLRFELGLFDPIKDQPYWMLGQGDIGTDEAKELNLIAALESLVLISNPGILPLKAGQRLAVLGPHGNASMDLIQVDTGVVCPPSPSAHAGEWQAEAADAGQFYCVRTPYQAIQETNGKNGTTTYVRGCDLSDELPGGFQQALAAAKLADVVILGLGISERETLDPKFMEREAHDRDRIDLPPVQQQLANYIIALGKPTVIFLLNGGMVAVEDFMNKKNVALIEAFYPGMEGANALAQSIFGIANRWGRMPYTVYHSNWTKHNSMLDHDVTHQRTYRYGADAVVPFGFGLSLSTFRLAFASAPTATLPLAYGSGGAVLETVEVEIRNLGPLVGDEVVMAYFHPKKVGLTMYPTKSLFDFQRVKNLQPAARITISFTITENSILLATPGGDLVRAPGDYVLTFENGAGEILSKDLTIHGEQVVVEPFPGKVSSEIFV